MVLNSAPVFSKINLYRNLSTYLKCSSIYQEKFTLDYKQKKITKLKNHHGFKTSEKSSENTVSLLTEKNGNKEVSDSLNTNSDSLKSKIIEKKTNQIIIEEKSKLKELKNNKDSLNPSRLSKISNTELNKEKNKLKNKWSVFNHPFKDKKLKIDTTAKAKSISKHLFALNQSQFSVGYNYGSFPFIAIPNSKISYYSSEGNFKAEILRLPLVVSYNWTSIGNNYGLNNFYKISLDVNELKNRKSKLEKLKIQKIEYSIDSLQK
jgi:hypothetical protein